MITLLTKITEVQEHGEIATYKCNGRHDTKQSDDTWQTTQKFLQIIYHFIQNLTQK